MEDHIYNIIKSNGSFDKSAKEITAHVFEFIEWSSVIHFDGSRWWIKGEEGKTTDELYQFWDKNVTKTK